jgi:hypothetical protein
MAGEISTDSKIKLGLAVSATIAVIALTNHLATIKSDIRELTVLVKGRFELTEYRIAQLETKIPGHAASAPLPSAAITSRPLSNINDIKESENE